MKRCLFSVLLICMVLSFNVAGADVVVDFDDVTTNSWLALPVPYAGFNWGAGAEAVKEGTAGHYTLAAVSELYAFCNTDGTGKIVVLIVCVFHFKKELKLNSFVLLPYGIGSLKGYVTLQVKFSEPREHLSESKLVALRPGTCLHLFNEICISKSGIG